MEQYRIVKQVGKGAFSTCYLLQHHETSQLAVAKITELKDERTRKMAESEVECLKILQGDQGHPHIVKLYDCIKLPQHMIVIMEYLEGMDLFEFLKSQSKGHVAVPLVTSIMTQLMTTLEYIHAKGVLYRDLKLDNVKIDANGNVKIFDFNLSTTFYQGQMLKDACGTPQFASPFVIFAGVFQQEYLADSSLDVWSLAVAAYGLCTGRFPLHSTTAQDLLQEQRELSHGLRKIWFPSHLPSNLVQTLSRLLQPGKRWTWQQVWQLPLFTQDLIKIDRLRYPSVESITSEMTLFPSQASVQQ